MATDKDTELMREYMNYLDDFVRDLQTHCKNMQAEIEIAAGCLDSETQKEAISAMNECIEMILSATPFAEGARNKLEKSKKYLESLQGIRFRR